MKKWVLLIVFLKSCVFLKTLSLLCFQQNTAFQKQKLYVEKNRKFMKNSGLFLNMAKWCFGGLFFEVLIFKRSVFGVSAIVSKSVKNACFSQCFGPFWGWFILLYILGMEGLGVFVLLVCVFVFFVLLLLLFCLFVFVLLLDCFLVLVLVLLLFLFFCFFSFVFLFLFFLFCFFGGFKGQVRWPKGPPHLALNPPYFFVSVYFVFCCFVFFCGGFKGQVRWPKGPPHLALNPPYFLFLFVFFVFVFFICFPFFVFNRQKNCLFPLKKGILV